MAPRFGKYQWYISASLRKGGFPARVLFSVVGYTQLGTFRRFLWFRRVLKKFLPPPRAILDAGCGAGEYAFYLAERFPQARVHACDASDLVHACQRIVREQKIPNIEFSSLNLETLDHREAYDWILCIEVLEHIRENRKALARLFDALRPGGYLFIRTPVTEERRFLPRSFLKTHNVWAEGEHEALEGSMDTLLPDLKAMGFEIPFSTYTNGFFGEAVFELEQLLRRLGPLFLLFVPPLKALSFLDLLVCPKRKGNGMLVLAKKPQMEGRGF